MAHRKSADARAPSLRGRACRATKRTALAAALLALPVLHAQADVVSNFHGIASTTINAANPAGVPLTPQEARTILATDIAVVHVAMYDAIVAIEGGYEPFAAIPTSPTAGASIEAAAATAACGTLQGMFPNRSAQYAAACASYLTGIADGDAKAKGIAIGIEVAQQVLAATSNDGRSANVVYASTGRPGDFDPFPTGSTPIATFMPFMTPLALETVAQFRAEGPPALDSATYAADFEEVKALGREGGALLTDEQKDIARFHTEAPPRFQARNYGRFLSDGLTPLENARLMGMLWVSVADATLACFESKYHYRFWRPRAAIQRADEDGNPATLADAGWQPFVATPNHPEYPAAHGCAAGALTEALREFFGTKKLDFEFDSMVTSTVHHFPSTDDFVKESMDARIYGGMHYRTSTVHGKVLGTKVAKWVTKHYFRPVVDPGICAKEKKCRG